MRRPARRPIDPDDPLHAGLLGSLQGNILKGHGRDLAVCLIIQFATDRAAVRGVLASIARRYVTSALRQHLDQQRFKATGAPGGIFGNLFLTAAGYRAVDLAEGGFDVAGVAG